MPLQIVLQESKNGLGLCTAVPIAPQGLRHEKQESVQVIPHNE